MVLPATVLSTIPENRSVIVATVGLLMLIVHDFL